MRARLFLCQNKAFILGGGKKKVRTPSCANRMIYFKKKSMRNHHFFDGSLII